MNRIVIIGNGITGITAAVTIRNHCDDAQIQIISSESDLFFSRTALMYIYMGHMRAKDTIPYDSSFFRKERLELIRDNVTGIDTGDRSLQLSVRGRLPFDMLLIATGSVPNRFWPGQDLPGAQGLYSMQDLELLEENTRTKPKRAVVVGGGLIGIELAEMLHTRNIPVTMLVREPAYWNNVLPNEEAEIVNAEIERHGIDLCLSTQMNRIEAGADGRVAAVVTDTGRTIPCQFVGLTAGVTPNIGLFKNSAVKTARGILVDRMFSTSVERVFAAGDCAQFKNDDGSPGDVEQLWYTGRMQGEAVGRVIASHLAGRPGGGAPPQPYDRGIPFNSAKFFTIEYQTYGWVPANPDPKTLLWRSGDGRRALRICWEETEGRRHVSGFNVMGMRLRQNVCQEWIRGKASPRRVIDELARANFDPEFYKKHESQIQRQFAGAIS